MASIVSLRAVAGADLPVFCEQQLDPEAARMAAFRSRTPEAFSAHWTRILADPKNLIRTIVWEDQVAGNVLSFDRGELREVGYWLGRAFWGKGIASAALAQFLALDEKRPLYGVVAEHNVGSVRVLEKCGFGRSGSFEEQGAGGASIRQLILRLDG